MSAEPPVGSTVVSDRGHEWRRDPTGWVGCLTCREDTPWTWAQIVDDCRDDPWQVVQLAQKG